MADALKILLVKTSSLGDVVSNLPVATDIARACPGATIDWVVEEAFSAIARLHPAVGRVIPVALRRWRKRWWQAAVWREVAALRASLGQTHYDFVIDTQGLLKSAWICRQARGLKCGYDRHSIREPLAAGVYDRRFGVSWQWQAVARNRQLAALALGYEIDAQGLPDYGLGARGAARAAWVPETRYCVLLTATSREEKLWPEAHWVALGQRLNRHAMHCLLPAGNPAERARAERIAAGIGGAQVVPPLDLAALADGLAGAACVVGVDTGLTHLAAALGRPVVGIYCGSDPAANGVIAARATNLGGPGAPPEVDAVWAVIAREVS